MHYGLSLPPFEQLADPALLARLARDAEDAGLGRVLPVGSHALAQHRGADRRSVGGAGCCRDDDARGFAWAR